MTCWGRPVSLFPQPLLSLPNGLMNEGAVEAALEVVQGLALSKASSGAGCYVPALAHPQVLSWLLGGRVITLGVFHGRRVSTSFLPV